MVAEVAAHLPGTTLLHEVPFAWDGECVTVRVLERATRQLISKDDACWEEVVPTTAGATT